MEIGESDNGRNHYVVLSLSGLTDVVRTIVRTTAFPLMILIKYLFCDRLQVEWRRPFTHSVCRHMRDASSGARPTSPSQCVSQPHVAESADRTTPTSYRMVTIIRLTYLTFFPTRDRHPNAVKRPAGGMACRARTWFLIL